MAEDNVHDLHDLTGRAALITGASRGIGRAIAEELASHGCAVALAARTADTVQQAAEAIEQSGGESGHRNGVRTRRAGHSDQQRRR